MPKQLKIWNGRWFDNNHRSHVYVCAYSQKDALELVSEIYDHHFITLGEIQKYWSAGCWGNAMDGITPERGLWVQIGRGTPVRKQPK